MKKQKKRKAVRVVKAKRVNSLLVNLLAGPGAGKSTMAASIFAELKWRGIDCELASEYAKDCVWEGRKETFNDQIYMFGKQYHRIFRLMGKVRVVITDSPLWLTPIYDLEKRSTLTQLVLDEMSKWDNVNIFLERKKKYNPKGRNQTEKQAKQIDRKIKSFLEKYGVEYTVVLGTVDSVPLIVDAIEEVLNESK